MDPHDRNARIAFVGTGRLGSSLALAASRAGYRVSATSSRRPEQRAWLGRHLPAAQACAAPGEAAAVADVVFLCVSDQAIKEVCSSIRWRADHSVIHCSGAQPLDALASAASAGAKVGGLHPLQTFPAPDATERIAGASFAVESADQGLRDWLQCFARGLGGVPFELRGDQRAAYHASAVLASGLLLPLVGLAGSLWERFDVPRERALASLLPLTTASVEALAAKGLPAALTGPFVRGDVETIRGHLQALEATPDVRRAYAALAIAALPLAAEQGGLSTTARGDIEALLGNALNPET